jgi:predicted DNA-binding transcriptional regulator YafY
MPDELPLARQWNLLRILGARHYGVTVREMAQETRVTEKTIRRDLDLFAKLSFPLEKTVGDRGRQTWKLAAGWGPPQLKFSFDEGVALFLCRRFLDPLAGTLLWQAAHSALGKIRSTLNKRAIDYLDQFPQLFHCTTSGFSDYTNKAEIIDSLAFAAEEHKAVHITYQSQQATEPATRDVYPYCLVRHKGALYLDAFAPEHDKVRRYKIDRIESVEVSNFTFTPPRDFDVQKHLAGSFGIYDGDGDVTVVVKFAPVVARYVRESKWHHSQVFINQRDGSLVARFTLTTTVEIKSWIRSFGPHAVVLEPEDLRAEIVRELEQLLQLYQEPAVARTVERRSVEQLTNNCSSSIRIPSSEHD